MDSCYARCAACLLSERSTFGGDGKAVLGASQIRFASVLPEFREGEETARISEKTVYRHG